MSKSDSKQKKSVLKKVIWGFGGLFGVLFLAALLVPFFVDVDQYRPQIEKAANEKINGELKLGKLSLSLWGQIRVEVEGVELIDSQKKQILKVEDAYFHIPFVSVFTGSPLITFKMNEPAVYVWKDQTGKMNLLQLVRSKDAGATQQSAPSAASKALPALVVGARLGIEFNNAHLTYEDQKTKLKSKVDELNVRLKNLSLSHPMEMRVWANLDTVMDKTIKVRGPFSLEGNALAVVKDGKITDVTLSMKADASEVDIQATDQFQKKAGVTLTASFKSRLGMKDGQPEALDLSEIIIAFQNVQMKGSAKVASLSQDANLKEFALQSNEFDLAGFGEMVPAIAEKKLVGKAKLEISASGPAKDPKYQVEFSFQDLSATVASVKTNPQFSGKASVSPDLVDARVQMKAPGSDLSVLATVRSFSRPKIELKVSSQVLDLDQWVDFPKKKKETSKETASSGASSPSGSKAPAQSSLTQAAQASPMGRRIEAQMNLNIGKLKAQGVEVSKILCQMGYQNLKASIDSCQYQVFQGTVSNSFQMDLSRDQPYFTFSTQVASLNLEKAVQSQVSAFENTLKGKADLMIRGSGSGMEPDRVIETLSMDGSMNVKEATFATIDIMKMVKEALNDSLEKISKKIPGMNGKKISSLPNHSSEYQSVTSDFSIKNAVFQSPNFKAVSKPNRGIDVEGNTKLHLKKKTLDAKWMVIDRHNLTKANDLSIEQQGVKVEHVLSKKGEPFQFPVNIGCTTQSPCYQYGEVPEYLANIALKNAGDAVASKAKQEVQKKANDVIKKALPGLKDKLGGFF